MPAAHITQKWTEIKTKFKWLYDGSHSKENALCGDGLIRKCTQLISSILEPAFSTLDGLMIIPVRFHTPSNPSQCFGISFQLIFPSTPSEHLKYFAILHYENHKIYPAAAAAVCTHTHTHSRSVLMGFLTASKSNTSIFHPFFNQPINLHTYYKPKLAKSCVHIY